jgi:hypothetical protein
MFTQSRLTSIVFGPQRGRVCDEIRALNFKLTSYKEWCIIWIVLECQRNLKNPDLNMIVSDLAQQSGDYALTHHLLRTSYCDKERVFEVRGRLGA